MKYDDFIGRLGFCGEELSLLAEAREKCSEETLSEARTFYDKGDEAFGGYLTALSEKLGVDVNILTLYIYLRFSENTYELCKAHGISDEDFLEMMTCWKIVSDICRERTGGYGVAQAVYRSWQRRFVDATIFKLGRLEFETVTSKWNFEVGGIEVREGDPVISVHIPRKAGFDEAACEASYERARKFFKKHYGLSSVVFICESWLIDPWLEECLSDDSTILNFQRKYKKLEVSDAPDIAIGWIFGKKLDNINDYPEDTTIRRAAKRKLLAGERIGVALGARL